VVLAAAVEDGKVSLVCTVSRDLTARLKAGALLQETLKITGGKGGGRPDFAQGGGGDPALLDRALEAFYPLVERSLSAR
jgi:alanyl-tRNA synthetase